MRNSLVDLLDLYESNAGEYAFTYRRGYRMVRWRYADVLGNARRFARELDLRGIGKGDRVGIWGENCAEWIVVFLGCVLRGAVAVPMDRIASPDFAVRVFRQVEAKLVAVSRDLAPQLRSLPPIVFEDLEESLSQHSDSTYLSPDLQRTDPLQIVFTSGTTADPKGVVISHGNVLANLEPLEREIAKYLKYERWFHPLRFLNLLPLSHVFGQFLGIFVPPLIGATVVFQDSLNPSEVLRAIKQERISVLIAVPRMLESLHEKLEREIDVRGWREWFTAAFTAAEKEKFQWRMWRFRRFHRLFGWKFWAFISGGAALDEATEKFWSRLGFAVIQGYGLTETTSLISVAHPFKLAKGAIGKVLPGRELRLDPDTGEILVRGENIASGFWQGKELQAVLGDEGWFRTGDLGALDENGNLYFKGRTKSVIVTSEGMNVHPGDLEAALKAQPEVRDAVVVGLRREGNAEPVAALILRDSTSPAEVVNRANKALAQFQQIRGWYVWPDPDFPRTSTQKPRTNVIEEQVNRELAGVPVASAQHAGPLSELILQITRGKVAHLNPNARLDDDLNLSSLDRVELMSALEDRYQVDLNESSFTQATTIGELESLLRVQRSAPPDYKYPSWAQGWPIATLRLAVYYALVWPATFLLAKPRVRGHENLQGVDGPALVISNHITYVDIGWILYALPARFREQLATAMIGEHLIAMRRPSSDRSIFYKFYEKTRYALVVSLFNVFPLPQRTGFRRSFEFAGESADRGYSVLVFPEGKRTETGELEPFRSGIGMLANRLNLPIVPMRIDGLYEYRIQKKHFVPPNQIRVSIGEPVQYAPDENPDSIAKDLQRRVAELTWK
jgi:long-chain acyl-CoA synthetase